MNGKRGGARGRSRRGRRFLLRWSFRLVRREWRQQLGLLALMVTAVAVAVGSIVAAFNLAEPPGSRFGTGAVGATLAGNGDEAVDALEAQGHSFGVIRSGTVRYPGSTDKVTVRAMDPANPVTEPLVTLVDGRWPTNPSEIAITDRAQPGTTIGDTIDVAGARTVVGLTENPTNLRDEFVLTLDLEPYGFEEQLVSTNLLVDADPADVTFPAGTWGITIEDGGSVPVRTFVAIAVSVVSTVALLIVGLLAVASFTVMARRRARQYGLLAAAGADGRQIRTAIAGTGITIGLFASTLGAVVGLVAALAVVPRLESLVDHRVDFVAPWWTVLPTVLLATTAATIAAWWPARAIARQPVTELLAATRPRTAATKRTSRMGALSATVGVVLLAAGVGRVSAAMVLPGLVLSIAGILLLTPGVVGLIGRRARSLPIAGRMAGREIARQQGRSAAIVAALAVALAIPAGISAVTSSIDDHNASLPPNLDDTMAIVWEPTVADEALVVPTEIDRDAMDLAGDRVREAAPEGSAVAAVNVVIDAADDVQPMELPGLGVVLATSTNFGLRPADLTCSTSCEVDTLGDRDENGNEVLVSFHETWVATPELLDALGVNARQNDPAVQAISRFEDATIKSHRDGSAPQPPNVSTDRSIPANAGIAPTLIWPATVESNGWETATVGWLVVADELLQPTDFDSLKTAAGEQLAIETPIEPATRTPLRLASTAVGAAIALGVVGAALTMLTAESAGNLRLLQAIGASPGTSRRLSAATAALLAAAGAVIAIPSGCLALVVLLADEFTDYRIVVPWPSLLMVTVVLPALAAAVGWATSRSATTGLGRVGP
ncbi:MAG: FtsX-like permease family protein [Acidimicrobiales bacterium]